jgi:hypothetical protein
MIKSTYEYAKIYGLSSGTNGVLLEWLLRPGAGGVVRFFCFFLFRGGIPDLVRIRLRKENQYESHRSALRNTTHRQGWKVEQISFITGSHSVNEEDLRKNLTSSSKSRRFVSI